MRTARWVALAGMLLGIALPQTDSNAAPRPAYPPLPEIGKIHSERFDQPYWFGTNSIDPDIWVESWSGYALIREQSVVAPWVVPMIGASTNLQINPERGAFRVWYRPSWSSLSTGLGMGPGGPARLLALVSSNETESVTYWSLAISSTGDELNLICEGESGPTVCASASIAFVAGEWHLLTVGYTETNSALFLDADHAASGSGVASVPVEAAGSSALVIGSGLAGDDVAMGEFDEFTAFSGWNLLRSKGGHEFGLSEFWNIANYYSNRIGRVILGPVSEEELILSPGGGTRPTGMEEEFGGGGMFAPLVLSGADCITNGPVLLTNVTASMTTNGAGQPVTEVGFNVIGGTNGPFSLYRSKDVSAPFLSTNWLWIQYVNPCDAVWLTNEPPVMSYYRVGPQKDSDLDGMPDDWEVLHGLDPTHDDAAMDPDDDGLSNYWECYYQTDPHVADSDYDGVCDGEEVYAAHPTGPLNADDVAHILLGSWRFDDTNWLGLQLQAPIAKTNLALVAGISGSAVSVNSSSPAWLAYSDTNQCIANLNLRKGSARFWFKGAWTSGAGNIGSAGSQPRLLEVGSKGSADGWFALLLDSGGTNLSFCTPTDNAGGFKTNYTVTVSWSSNQWHQIVATWSPTNTSCFVDGVLKTNGSAILTWPNAAARAGGFRIGSDIGGTNQAKARFDNLETWSYELSAAEVTAGLSGCPPSVDVMLVLDRSSSMGQPLDGTITKFEAAKEAATNFVGHLRLDPDQAGLVSFWSNTFMYQGLTTVRTSILTAITSLTDSNGTRMDYGITNAYAELTNQAHRNPASLGAMVLLTDGFNEGGTSNEVTTAADAVTNAGLKMVTIGLGPNADTNLLKRIASTTNDCYWATNQSQLDQAYNSIANTLCRLTNLAPTVSITNPANDQSFPYPASIRIEATASDPENGLVKVEFYGGTNGTTLIGSDYHAPFTAVWSGAVVGTNVLRAVAYDEYGLTSTDSVNVVVISVPPTVHFVSPTNGQLFVFSPTNISITATASVAGPSITNLSIYQGTNRLAETNGAFCQVLWTAVPAGTNALSAIAADSLNRRATNDITITNNFAPAVTITAPTNYQAYQQVTNVTVTATASDIDGVVTNVTFYSNTTSHVNGRLPGLSGSNSSVWSLTWTNPPSGTNFVIAVAVDNRGVSNSSTIRLLKVQPTNPPPSVAIIYPASNAVFNAGANLTIAATATNFPASVTNVQFFANGHLLGSDDSKPYSVTECCWKPGTYELMARAVDISGAAGISEPVRLTVLDRTPGSGTGFWDPEFTIPEEGYLGVLTSFRSNLYCAFAPGDDNPHEIWRWDGTNLSMWHDPGHWVQGMAANEEGLAYAEYHDGPTWIYRYDGTNRVGLGTNSSFANMPADVRWWRWFNLKYIGPDLFAYGEFELDVVTNYCLARYNPADETWDPVGGVLDAPIYALESFMGELVIGGSFGVSGAETNLHRLAHLVSGQWQPYAGGVFGTNSASESSSVFALAACGTNLFVGGDFSIAGTVSNANAIAIWNGQAWQAMGGGPANWPGMSGNYYLADPLVMNVCPHGNSVYVAGQFSAVAGLGVEPTPVSAVAKAEWSEELQQWIWSDLDLGVYNGYPEPGFRGLAAGAALMEGTNSGAYDFVVGGYLGYAGESMTNRLVHYGEPPYNGLARWRVGGSPATNAPLVWLTAPTNYAVFTNNPVSLTLTALTFSVADVLRVEFYENGNLIGTDTATPTNNHLTEWSSPVLGLHLLKAVAVDTNGVQGESTPVLVSIKDPGSLVTAMGDSFTLPQNNLPVSLPVLTNDTPATELRVSAVAQAGSRLGTAARAHDGRGIIYTPLGNVFGTERLAYSVTNASGDSDSAWVTVKILSKPTVKITSPQDESRFGTNSIVSIMTEARDYDGTVTNVSLVLNGATVAGQTADALHTFTWSTNAVGFYLFQAVVSDSDGQTSQSGPVTLVVSNGTVSPHGPTALLANPMETNSEGIISLDTAPVVRDGFLDLEGTAADLDGDPVSYAVFLYRPEDLDSGISDDLYTVVTAAKPYADLTPLPLNPQRFRGGAVTNGALGRLDLTRFANGTYYLALRVRGGTDETNAIVRFQLASQLKIGQFSFSEQDLVLPVNGIPLTVTRTYNSLNPRSADFGYSWTMSLNTMDVELDDVRRDVVIGSPEAPFADDEEDENGLPKVVSIRTGGGWDVTLNLPDGGRTTFAFTPFIGSFHAEAQWTAPPDVHATLRAYPPGSETIEYFPSLYWHAGGDNSTFDNHDIPGWVLETLDGTKYYIERGDANNVVWDSRGAGNFVNVQAYGAPKLTKIVQRTGDWLSITDDGVAHYNPSNHLTRSVLIDRDGQGRVTAIWDPVSQIAAVYPSVRYVYNQDTGNLIQVLKLVNRETGAYLTNRYHYDNPNFPHYLTSIENPLGIPVARNEYDDGGRLTAMVDAEGNRTEYVHSTSNRVERVIDRMGFTNTFAYDFRGNVTAATNALNGITLVAYDDLNNKTNEIAFMDGQPYATNRWVCDPTNGLLLTGCNPLGYTNVYTYDAKGQVLVSINPRGYGSTNGYDENTGNLASSSDALANTTTYRYNSLGLLISSADPLGTITTNVYDASGNLLASAVLTVQTTISPVTTIVTVLSTNSYAYDENGNRTRTVVWRRVNGVWSGATNTFVLDALNRTVQAIAPDGGTNKIVYNEIGCQSQTIDAMGRVTAYAYDTRGRLVDTIYPDLTTNSAAYDENGRRTNSLDQLSRSTVYVYDALGRMIETIYADNTTNRTVYDDLGRVRFSVDARGTTNAFGYDASGRRVAVANALGTGIEVTHGFLFDPVGNQTVFTDAMGRSTTNVFDALNRQVQMCYPDATKTFTGYDAVGRRLTETNQDGIITRFGYDGLGRLTSVTDAMTNVTSYAYDEAGNQTNQVDALGRKTLFEFDSMGRRTKRSFPGLQAETMGHDLAGNMIRHTNFNGVVLTNNYDAMNRLTNRSSTGGYQVIFAYSAAGQRTNMVDGSGTSTYVYDLRDRLITNTTIAGTLSYWYDAAGNVTNVASSTVNGTRIGYQYDALNRLTNVIDGRLTGVQNTALAYDPAGNLQSFKYPNGVTNAYRYDSLNRLTNLTWKLSTAPLADFSYQMMVGGTRTNAVETVDTSSYTNRWSYDLLYRLTTEKVLAGSGSGTNIYAYDTVGNRLTRTVNGFGSPFTAPTNQNFAFDRSDRLDNDSDPNTTSAWFDANGNATNYPGTLQYDVENRLTNVNSGVALIFYNGDGQRVKKVGGGVTTLFLVDSLSPSGYSQVLEELTVSGPSTNLACAYVYGPNVISQRQPGIVTNFYGLDGHSSVRFLLTPAGTLNDTYVYDAYGNLLGSAGVTVNHKRYCGEEVDLELGTYYLRARYFSSQIGRFWTMDTYEGDEEEPPTLHKYLYCANDPVNNSDLTGNDFEALAVGDTLATFDGFHSSAGNVKSVADPVTSATLQKSRILADANGFHWNAIGDVKFANRENCVAIQWQKTTAWKNGQRVTTAATGGPLDGTWHIDGSPYDGDQVAFYNGIMRSSVGLDVLIDTAQELRYRDQPGWHGLKSRDIYSLNISLKLIIYDISANTPKVIKESNVLVLKQGGVWRNVGN